MRVIGLTGGIGTGKSTVSEYLKEKGCVILDADRISREMTEKGSPALADIRKTFGGEYLTEEGELDRKALGDLVFCDAEALGLLQQIITEKVAGEIDLRLSAMRESGFGDIAVIDAPLLFECGMEDRADENWLVTAGLETRVERVMKRDGLSESQVLARIEHQMPEEEKRGKSQFILDNSGSVESLYKQIDERLERIRDEI